MKRRKLFTGFCGFVAAVFLPKKKSKTIGFNPSWAELPYSEWQNDDQFFILPYRTNYHVLLKEIIRRNEPRQYT